MKIFMILGFVLLSCAHSEKRNFALVKKQKGTHARILVAGDMPYNDNDRHFLNNILSPLLKSGEGDQFDSLVVLGDIKGGGEACTTELLTANFNLFQNLLPGKFIITPGDNDWTDCDRKIGGIQFSEIEKLKEVRTLFYKNAKNDRKDIESIANQKNFPENLIWKHESTLLGTFHVVGTNNGRAQILNDPIELAIAEVDKRDEANLIWLEKFFKSAAQSQYEYAVIFFHADFVQAEGEACKKGESKCHGFKRFIDQLKDYTVKLGKPVLIVHGDTSPMFWDKPFSGVKNLYRINAPGDHRVRDALVIDIIPNKDNPFQVSTLLNGPLSME